MPTPAAPREGAAGHRLAGTHGGADRAYPLRLTLSRKAGANLRGTYPDMVNVTRTARSVFGNPHHYNVPCPLCPGVVHTRPEAGLAYRQVLRDDPALVDEARRTLAGRPLACYCPQPEPGEVDACHAALLIRVAAGEEP